LRENKRGGTQRKREKMKQTEERARQKRRREQGMGWGREQCSKRPKYKKVEPRRGEEKQHRNSKANSQGIPQRGRFL
jgi:hypothetical protein